MCSVSYIFVTAIFSPSCSSYHDTLDFSSTLYNINMETAEYWPMAREYGIWNAAIASLQFWAEDLDPVTLGRSFWTCILSFLLDPNQPHLMPSYPKKPYLGCFILALNAAFTQQLSLQDEGYESGSTKMYWHPYVKMPCIHHVSRFETCFFQPYTALHTDQ